MSIDKFAESTAVPTLTEEVKLKLEQELIDNLDEIGGTNADACKRLWNENRDRMLLAKGSNVKHQAWDGGYLCHLVDIMRYSISLYEYLQSNSNLTLDFTRTDAFLVLFLHDLEKPWKYVEPTVGFANDEEKKNFIQDKINVYGISLTGQHINALKYIHGEGRDYDPNVNIQQPLAALCHACDNNSARITRNTIPPID